MMSVESVKKFFADAGLPYKVRELDKSTETVPLAARALGVAPALIAKTLAFRMKDRVILVVTRGDARIDNKKFKQQFQMKAKMMSQDDVLEATGHPVGGVCPFGLKRELDIYLDIGLKDFEKVYPAAGSGNACVEMSPDELSRVTGAHWVDVCKH
jgi:Cys-tRNA(Pro) deacylase